MSKKLDDVTAELDDVTAELKGVEVKKEDIKDAKPEAIKPVVKKKSFGLVKKVDKSLKTDSLDDRFGSESQTMGWLFLEDGVIKRRTEFGTLQLVDASLINSEKRLLEIKGRIDKRKDAGHKVYFTSQADLDAFKDVAQSYGFKDDQIGGLLPSLNEGKKETKEK